MNQVNAGLFYPCLAMLVLTFIVLVHMFITRVVALKSKVVRMSYFRTYSTKVESLPDQMLQAARNFTNLFEVPTLFYMVCLFATVLNQVDQVLIVMAWVYVAIRCFHSFIHLTNNNVTYRSISYGLSWLVLIFFACRLALKLLFLNFF
jgi:hypothetical protein